MHIDSTRKSSEGVCPDRRHRSLLQKSRSVLAAVYSSGVLSRARAKQVAIPPSNNGQQRKSQSHRLSPEVARRLHCRPHAAYEATDGGHTTMRCGQGHLCLPCSTTHTTIQVQKMVAWALRRAQQAHDG
ncbi:hypothetical protein PsYK624_129300 [Phanerochaete sordida]|uniref:Uncharacterized protein n=1 Tax=Phanerochaete sordida TaxID=48140 RepID=A0A9P3GNQ1_9APHY|nr:hypothetical protein PsYK624_129300 [Phanerochaete sordida]